MEIGKVRKQGPQKIVCVPAKSKIQPGDHVAIHKVEDMKSSKQIQLELLKDKFPEAYKYHMKKFGDSKK